MTDEVIIYLDNKEITFQASKSLWENINAQDIEIPILCKSTQPDFHADGNCRVCLVEVVGKKNLVASCVTYPLPGMQVITNSKRVKKSQQLIMEMLLTEANYYPQTEFAYWANSLNVTKSRFGKFKKYIEKDSSHFGIKVDLAACIHCMRCIQACRDVEVHDVMGIANRSSDIKVIFDDDISMGDSSCVSCGACAQTCPTGAIQFKLHT